jgi:uncharacterized protein (TIGR00730 family)
VERLCVFCGSSAGNRPAYADAARLVGTRLAERGIGLVYGGGRVGLMGVVADAVLAAGGEAIGVIPRSLVDRELAHTGLTELRVVDSMHARKALMHELSAAFVALPGGFGTLDELAEAVTWSQLGLHRKPCGLLDVERYFAALVAFLERATADGFVGGSLENLLVVDDDVGRLLDRLQAHEPPRPRWSDGGIRP